MDQNKCVALLTAIDLGNLTRAAEQLGYTQSDSVMSSRPWRQSWVFPFWSAPVPASVPPRTASGFSLCCGTWTERAASWSRRPPISAAWPWAPSPGHLSLHLPFLAAGNPPGLRPALPRHHRLHPGERAGGAG